MSIYFIDTSSLAKRYVQELGSAWLKACVEPQNGNPIIISELTIVELISLITRLRRERKVSASVAGLLRIEFLRHSQCKNV